MKMIQNSEKSANLLDGRPLESNYRICTSCKNMTQCILSPNPRMRESTEIWLWAVGCAMAVIILPFLLVYQITSPSFHPSQRIFPRALKLIVEIHPRLADHAFLLVFTEVTILDLKPCYMSLCISTHLV